MKCKFCGTNCNDDAGECPGCGSALIKENKPKQFDIPKKDIYRDVETESKIGYESRQTDLVDSDLSQSSNNDEKSTFIHNNEDYSFDKFVTAYITGSVSATGNKAVDYYSEVFKKFNGTDKRNNWNWLKFIVNVCNLLYRKQYGLAILLAFLSILLSIPSSGIGGLVVCVFVALKGDYLIYKKFKAKMAEAINLYQNDYTAQLKYIAKSGGTSCLAVTLYLVLSIFLGFVIAM